MCCVCHSNPAECTQDEKRGYLLAIIGVRHICHCTVHDDMEEKGCHSQASGPPGVTIQVAQIRGR